MYKNPVLELFIEIKTKYIAENGSEQLFNYTGTNCLHYWVSHISDNKEYLYILSCLTINEYNDMIILHYDDIRVVDFDAYDGLFQETRSIAIDIKNDAIVLLPFKKFFNINEREDTQLHIVKAKMNAAKSVEISTKLDGCFVAVRWYNGKLVVSSAYNLDKNNSQVLSKAYEYINENIINLAFNFPHITFMFELISDVSQIVVSYPKSAYGLYLFGIRNCETGHEYSYAEVLQYAETYNLKSTNLLENSFDQVLNEIHREDFDPTTAEGFVINICDMDGNNHRYKVKYDNYVVLHSLVKKATAVNQILNAVKNNTIDDMIAYIPDAFKDRTIEIVDNIKSYVSFQEKKTIEYYNMVQARCGDCDNKKFALAAKHIVPKEFFGKVMNIKSGKKNDHLRGIKYHQIVETLGE